MAFSEPNQPRSLTELARAGFSELSRARDALHELDPAGLYPQAAWLEFFSESAHPDAALHAVNELLRRHPDSVTPVLAATPRPLIRLLGASEGFAAFYLRNPQELAALRDETEFPDPATYLPSLLESVTPQPNPPAGAERANSSPTPTQRWWDALRIRCRRHLAQLASIDLGAADAAALVPEIAAHLTALAAAALEASLQLARRTVCAPGNIGGSCTPEQVAATNLAVIAMGKAGAEELNYVSDVDVIFVAEADPAAVTETFGDEQALAVATRLARELMKGIHAPSIEPALWEVDPNLRPEGRDGALVRTVQSHRAYYDRWAQGWEFQALLKARHIAGATELGERYLNEVWPLVWGSANRDRFVESVQAMRERVTANIPQHERARQIKLGPGGLRDVEFTVQLLQLVHGQSDETLRVRGTLPALARLRDGGYIGRDDADEFAAAYRELRLLEHRMQLWQLRRTALMPADDDGMRWLARATGLAATADELQSRWEALRARVRALHVKLFYRPLLAVAATAAQSLTAAETTINAQQAQRRLAAIGFRDPAGALRHIAALTAGLSRRASIQRTLLPVLLQWFSAGANPDAGMLAFRRISESLGATPWYLRMLRDGATAAERLTVLLSGARFVSNLMERIPESVAWLEGETHLAEPRAAGLAEELASIRSRHHDLDSFAAAVLQVRRREVLRAAMASCLGLADVHQSARTLSTVTRVVLQSMVDAVCHEFLNRQVGGPGVSFAVIAMGRFGGAELSFGSDTDVLFVYREESPGDDPSRAAALAARVVNELQRVCRDPWVPFEFDLGLRPEGKNGPVVRSLDSYEAYYTRWSLTWEAQALLRATPVAGDERLAADFMALVDRVRFAGDLSDADVREVRRIKARVESERLPQGADPLRHVKLGRGSLSDVEWLVQLLQLRHGHRVSALRTVGTLAALAAAVEHDLLDEGDAALLRESWVLCSALRSAITLSSGRAGDVLPKDRDQLETVARLLGYAAGAASTFEEHYLSLTRRTRHVFERVFYET